MQASQQRSEPLPPEPDRAVRFTQPVHVDAFGLTHPGLVRASNEDHFLISRIGRYFETVSTNLPDGDLPGRADEAGYSLIVADGMGGHAGGEIASRLAIREIVRLALALPDWIVRIEGTTIEAAAERAQSRIEKLNELVIERAREHPDLRGMGTTLTAVRNLGRVLQIAHVGDSRAYLLREGILHRLTKDHTYVQELVDSGELTPEEALKSTARHVLTNAVGGFNDDVQVDVERLQLARGDRIMLCSDGLTDGVDDAAIRATLQASPTAEAASRALVDRALASGGRDNITVVVAGYSWTDTE